MTTPTTKPTVLVIEDNSDHRELYAVILGLDGYEVQIAETAAEGLALAIEAPPAAILLDLGLPDVDGIEALRRLRQEPALASTPVVVVSANVFALHRSRALEAGANHFLGKPVAPADLRQAFRQVLAGRNAVT
jgi:CheY-like chemotaxis protein